MIITCRQVSELLTEDAENALRGYNRARVRLHLKICTRCQAHKKQLDTTVAVLRAMPHEAPPEDLVATLIDVAKRNLKG